MACSNLIGFIECGFILSFHFRSFSDFRFDESDNLAWNSTHQFRLRVFFSPTIFTILTTKIKVPIFVPDNQRLRYSGPGKIDTGKIAFNPSPSLFRMQDNLVPITIKIWLIVTIWFLTIFDPFSIIFIEFWSFFMINFFFGKIDTFSRSRRYPKCVNLSGTTVIASWWGKIDCANLNFRSASAYTIVFSALECISRNLISHRIEPNYKFSLVSVRPVLRSWDFISRFYRQDIWLYL